MPVIILSLKDSSEFDVYKLYDHLKYEVDQIKIKIKINKQSKSLISFAD